MVYRWGVEGTAVGLEKKEKMKFYQCIMFKCYRYRVVTLGSLGKMEKLKLHPFIIYKWCIYAEVTLISWEKKGKDKVSCIYNL
jgi:hypothetical protein